MDTTILLPPRSRLDSLACVNEACELYGQAGQGNLTVRKVYSKDRIRYLRCRACQREFSERKGTALWNTKVPEAKAVAVGEHLAEGCSVSSTVRLVDVDRSVVKRLTQRLGEHGEAFHEARAKEIEVEALQADERHGYAGNKGQPAWKAEVIDPASKFVLAHEQGRRDERLIRRLLTESAKRLRNRHDLVLFTDGDASYASLFAELFGRAYQPPRRGSSGRRPKPRFRIPRTLAHVQVIKQREGRRVVHIEIRYAHGSKKRVQQALDRLGYTTPNTACIERRNGTARSMSAYQVRRSLAFAHRPDAKHALGWWGVTVYNWCRPHRSLRLPLAQPIGKKSTGNARLPWPSAWPIPFFPSVSFCSPLSFLPLVEIISPDYHSYLPLQNYEDAMSSLRASFQLRPTFVNSWALGLVYLWQRRVLLYVVFFGCLYSAIRSPLPFAVVTILILVVFFLTTSVFDIKVRRQQRAVAGFLWSGVLLLLLFVCVIYFR